MVVDYGGKSLSQRWPVGQVTCTFLNCGTAQILGNGNLEYQQLHNERKYMVKNYSFVIIKCLFYPPRIAGNQCRKQVLFHISQNTLCHMDMMNHFLSNLKHLNILHLNRSQYFTLNFVVYNAETWANTNSGLINVNKCHIKLQVLGLRLYV